MTTPTPTNAPRSITEPSMSKYASRADYWRAMYEAAQSKIDRLMLEYCPDEMTPEQMENWAAHQKPVEEMMADHKAALELAKDRAASEYEDPARKNLAAAYLEVTAQLEAEQQRGDEWREQAEVQRKARERVEALHKGLMQEQERRVEEAEQPEMRHMVTRFLKWPLPPSVCADLCATDYGKEGRCGTNLLNAEEAENMLRYVLRGRAFAYGMLKMEAEGLRKRAETLQAKLAAVEVELLHCATDFSYLISITENKDHLHEWLQGRIIKIRALKPAATQELPRVPGKPDDPLKN